MSGSRRDELLETIKKGLFAGIGAVVLSRDKIESVGRKLVEESKLSREDANKLVDELLETGERQWADFEQAVSDAVRKALRNLDIGSKAEEESLKKRVSGLEKRLSTLESAMKSAKEA